MCKSCKEKIRSCKKIKLSKKYYPHFVDEEDQVQEGMAEVKFKCGD